MGLQVVGDVSERKAEGGDFMMGNWRRRWAPVVLGVLMAAVCSGCYLPQLLVAVIKPEEKKEVKAAYALESERLVIVVYAGTDVLFTYPTVPLEISRDLVGEIVTNLKPKIKTIVHPVEVVMWQESNLDWTNMAPIDIAKTFKADTMLYIELEQYTTIEERSANLLRGHIRASVQVIKVGAEGNPVYRTNVEVLFPEERPVGVLEERNDSRIRAGASMYFARDVIAKFYDRTLIVRGGVAK
jgi:hypothetical protein